MQPSDSISNAPRRNSDISGHNNGNNAYVLLDLPDLSRDNAAVTSLGLPPSSESVRSLGDVNIDRKSSTGSSRQVC